MLLRAAAGPTLVAQGLLLLFSPPSVSAGSLIISILLTLTGVFILIGFLTPMVGSLAVLECAVALVWTAFPWGLLASSSDVFRLIAIFVAIVLIGPGALSVDARIFGWKEIVIPSPAARKEEE